MTDNATDTEGPQLEGVWNNGRFVLAQVSSGGAWIESDRSQDVSTMDWYNEEPDPIEAEATTKTCLNPRCTNDTETVYCSNRCGVAHQDHVRDEMGGSR